MNLLNIIENYNIKHSFFRNFIISVQISPQFSIPIETLIFVFLYKPDTMTTEQIQLHIDSLLELMKEVDEAILSIYAQFEAGEEVHKDDMSPLTKADMISNQIICNFLRKATPDITIISEENKAISYEERKNKEWLWMVDPLDGTKEFIKKNGDFTVNVALLQNGSPVASVVSVPALGEHYYAIKGKGAHKKYQGRLSSLKCSSFSLSDSGLRIVASRSHRNEETENYISQYSEPNLVFVGSSLKIIRVAEGVADIYPRLGPTMEWDIAAAEIILTEAGGSLLQTSGDPLEYNKEDLLNPHFIAKGIVKDEQA